MPKLKVSEIGAEPLVVGRLYRVPTFRAIWHGIEAIWTFFGPAHIDEPEIMPTPGRHIHVDGRFLGWKQWLGLRERFGSPEMAIASETAAADDLVPVWRELFCHRASISYPHREMATTRYLQCRFANDQAKRVRGEWVCPHQGARLGSILPDDDGIITCPLHGLRWRIADGQPGWSKK